MLEVQQLFSPRTRSYRFSCNNLHSYISAYFEHLNVYLIFYLPTYSYVTEDDQYWCIYTRMVGDPMFENKHKLSQKLASPSPSDFDSETE